MGEQNVQPGLHGERRREFMNALLADLRALEHMIEHDMIERGCRRIGAEQELFLVDQAYWPAPGAQKVLSLLEDGHFTNELALFNLEINLDPVDFGDDCLHRMEQQLDQLVARTREAASRANLEVVLTGILPTIRKSDLELGNMTPNPRYFALNDALTGLRGDSYEFRIRGRDELLVKHDTVMVEACNASFQAHFQVSHDEFPLLYNIAQVLAAPVMAATCNSPILFGRRLWAETRIALFEQAVDTRRTGHDLRQFEPRVWFGRNWVRNSVLELFREDVARFRTLIGAETSDPFDQLEQGQAPDLKSLRLHNSTVYRWNRACYGVMNGIPHLRIENRILPSGPTVVDEVANAALWFGLVSRMAHEETDVTKLMSFDDANGNFHAAAQSGLRADLTWFDGEAVSARDLLAKRLLAMSREGLEEASVRGEDIDRYLGVIEERIETGSTGSTWLMRSFDALRTQGTPGERLAALTGATLARQKEGQPVSSWELARLEEGGGWKNNYLKVEQFMTTDLYTVQEDDPIDLVANLMDWERIRHVLVEDGSHHLVGLISYRSLVRTMGRRDSKRDLRSVAVGEIMKREPLTITPETRTLDAINLMRENRIACLPVVRDKRLVGVVTERDFMDLTAGLLEDKLRD